MPNSTLNIGIAGFGKAAETYHSPFINAVNGLKLKLHAVLERNKSRAEELYPWVKTYREYQDMLSDSELDVIVITTPNDLHYEMARQALLAGKHLVVDKPFTISTVEADDLIDLAQETGKVLTVFHNRRLDGDFITIRKYINEKLLGEVQKVEIRFDRFRPDINTESWRETTREGSGLLYDLGAHLIDQALALFGYPEKIESKVLRQRPDAKSDDFFEINLYYPNTKVLLSAGMLVAEATPHILLYAKEGELIIPELDPQEAYMKKGILPTDPSWPKEFSAQIIKGNSVENIKIPAGNYSLYYENLFNAIVKNEPLLVKPTEAREVIRLIESLKA